MMTHAPHAHPKAKTAHEAAQAITDCHQCGYHGWLRPDDQCPACGHTPTTWASDN